MTHPVLHVDFISLSDSAAPDAVDHLVDAAADLTSIEGVLQAGLIEGDAGSDFSLAVYFVLRGFPDLEPFGTDPRYTRFLQGAVAPVLRAFGGASVQLESAFPAEVGPYGACLALAAPEETYDFEVRQALEEWSRGTGSSAGVVGLAIGERQRYRGCVLTFSDTPLIQPRPAGDRFEMDLIAGPARQLR